MRTKRIAVIGASYLQVPLIEKAMEMGLEVHAFAWECGDPGESLASVFHPLSIIEKDAILEECRLLHIDGVCTIASDLAAITVGYVANALGLPCNTPQCIVNSTDKSVMRAVFSEFGDPSPISRSFGPCEPLNTRGMKYPLIVKPSDRSGSRGVAKVMGSEQVSKAARAARDVSLSKRIVIEEFLDGEEYSVESISWNGCHRAIAITKKFTTGAPNFIERGHMQPSMLSDETEQRIKAVVYHALDSLGVTQGASHSEIKIDSAGRIGIVEIGARMGGDMIGAKLVPISTGYDYLKAVIDCSLGIEPVVPTNIAVANPVGIRFIFDRQDVSKSVSRAKECKVNITECHIEPHVEDAIQDSSGRHGYYLVTSAKSQFVEKYLSS